MTLIGAGCDLSALRAGVLAVGDKGFHLLSDLYPWLRVTHIATYAQATASFAVDDFRALAEQLGASLHVAQRPELDFAADVDIVFTVGWQHLLPAPPPNLVILHDSLLPRSRGFAPTVNALQAGAAVLGVSAILPGPGVDDGPILAQKEVQVTPPVKIAKALASLRDCYLSVARQVCEALARGQSLAAQGRAQDEARASYSHWRDEFDYLVDWTLGAEAVLRQIYAVGAPYPGAIAFASTGEKFLIDDAELGEDITFINRTPGKFHAIAPGRIDVVCGSGIARITRWRTSAPWAPKLRTRFVDVHVAQLLLMQERSAGPH